MERAELMPIANKYLPPSPSTKLGQQQRTRVTTIGSGRVPVIQKAKWIRQKKKYKSPTGKQHNQVTRDKFWMITNILV
jgi:hypothetical protein